MTFRDDHEQAFRTDPHYRPLLWQLWLKDNRNRRDRSWRRLVHNHPSGDPTPSRADIDMTKAIIAVAKPLGIAVHDHIIVGKDGHASLKGVRLM